MDPRTFDGIVQRLAGSRTRRSVFAGSVLAVLSLGEAALAKNQHKGNTHAAKRHGAAKKTGTVTAQGLNINERCPKKKHGKKLTCNDCRTGFSVPYTNAKGKPVRKCACKPVGEACTGSTAVNCCSGVCGEDGTCVSPTGPGQTCVAVGVSCTANAQCCTGICDVGGSETAPVIVSDPATGNKCSICLTGGATCDPNSFLRQCCYSDCIEVAHGGGVANICCSLAGENCTPTGSTATVLAQGTCCSGGDVCPATGGALPPNVCCTASGEITPALSDCGTGGNTGQGCCTGQCRIDLDTCCAPAGADPTLSGGPACVADESNEGCCNGTCNAAVPGTCL